MADKIYLDNEEATEAWNTVLFERFRDYRHVFVTALKQFGDDALASDPPTAGDRAVDIGCGFGDTTQQIAEIVGPDGSATGIDAASRFIEAAQKEAAEAGIENVSYFVADAEREVPGGPYDYAFARMGTMFFANPVAAMRNVCNSLRPGGRLCMVVWRRKLDNEWFQRSEEVVDSFVPPPDYDESDALTCGPGPFSMANADTVSTQLIAAGFEHVGFRRIDVGIVFGHSLDDAVEAAFAIGPAAETIRVSGEAAEAVRPQIEAGIRELAKDFQQPDGSIVAPGSAWVVTARRR